MAVLNLPLMSASLSNVSASFCSTSSSLPDDSPALHKAIKVLENTVGYRANALDREVPDATWVSMSPIMVLNFSLVVCSYNTRKHLETESPAEIMVENCRVKTTTSAVETPPKLATSPIKPDLTSSTSSGSRLSSLTPLATFSGVAASISHQKKVANVLKEQSLYPI